ncbi:Global transcription regulator sge1 [Marasmius sp. AFHP31]|nr:Global transcription regulator sge1 [Marasmius sp. AFHP31]
MSASSGQQAAPTTWTEPPWCGWIETTGDALLILEAARRGLIPRVTRRLVDSERKMITSGSVFVFDEDESGIKRWTDGFYWSPSRILGNFLLYRETDKKTTGRGRGGGSDNNFEDEGNTLSRPRDGTIGSDRQRERNLVGSLTNNPKFKTDGLMKKARACATFSLTIGGVAQHLISYYRVEDVENGRLRSPSSLPELASLAISPEYLDKTHFRNPPKVEIGPDGIPRYRGEADDVETGLGTRSPNPPSLPVGPPLLSEGVVTDTRGNAGKRRYEPYAPPSVTKRPRKGSSDHEPTPSPVAAPVMHSTATQPNADIPQLPPAMPVATTPPASSPQPAPAPPQTQYPESHSQSTTPPVQQVSSPVQHPYYYYPGYGPHPHMYPYHQASTSPPAQAALPSPQSAPPSVPNQSSSTAHAASPVAYSPGASGSTTVPYPYDPNAMPQQQQQQQVYYPYGYYPSWTASYGYAAQHQHPTAASGTDRPVDNSSGSSSTPT